MTSRCATPGTGLQSGVTLVEIVVALAVVALTLGIAAGGLRLLGRSGERGAEVIARHDVLSRGLDVLRSLRATCAEVPIVVVTGAGSEEIAVAAMKLGAADYVRKRTATPADLSKSGGA